MKRQIETRTTTNESLWAATVKTPHYPPLRENTHADVCIIGAGIAGLTTAYLLTRAGQSVVVLDDGPPAGGMTCVTTAHLTIELDYRYARIERLHGEQGARLAYESHAAAIDRIEEIVRSEHIDCDFERLDGYLLLSPGDDEKILDEEMAALRRAGMFGVIKLNQGPTSTFESMPCLRFPNQAQFHPLKYTAALARAIEREGGRIFEGTHADRIDGGQPARTKAGPHTVTAGSVVVATNTPVNDKVAIHTKQVAYMSYVIGAHVPHGSVPKALYWDTQDPYHYVRLARGREVAGGPEHDFLIAGGEDHKTGQADDRGERHARLETWARERFPLMGQVEFTWAGQLMQTIDGLAFIGRNPLDEQNVFIATGDSGTGMTHGTIAGILLTDLILGRANPWTTLYDPSRKTLRAAGTYVGEALNMAAQYTDWASGGEVGTAEEIPPDSGGVLRRGLTKVAVYRDAQGRTHELSAVCVHLGCIVRWNAVERTWDCPCHGSQFDKLGKVIHGPANKDLAPIDKE